MSVTRESVWECADRLEGEDVAVTLRAVRERLGGGSYATITPLLSEWRQKKEQLRPAPPPVPEELISKAQSHIRQLWSNAMEIADAALQMERDGMRVARQESVREQESIAELADDLARQLENASTLLRSLEDRVGVLEEEVTTQRDRAVTAETRLEEVERFRLEERDARLSLLKAVEDHQAREFPR